MKIFKIKMLMKSGKTVVATTSEGGVKVLQEIFWRVNCSDYDKAQVEFKEGDNRTLVAVQDISSWTSKPASIFHWRFDLPLAPCNPSQEGVE